MNTPQLKRTLSLIWGFRQIRTLEAPPHIRFPTTSRLPLQLKHMLQPIFKTTVDAWCYLLQHIIYTRNKVSKLFWECAIVTNFFLYCLFFWLLKAEARFSSVNRRVINGFSRLQILQFIQCDALCISRTVNLICAAKAYAPKMP